MLNKEEKRLKRLQKSMNNELDDKIKNAEEYLWSVLEYKLMCNTLIKIHHHTTEPELYSCKIEYIFKYSPTVEQSKHDAISNITTKAIDCKEIFNGKWNGLYFTIERNEECTEFIGYLYLYYQSKKDLLDEIKLESKDMDHSSPIEIHNWLQKKSSLFLYINTEEEEDSLIGCQ